MHEQQYPIVAARRQAYDTLLWQVPALSVAAQGFLVATALNKDTPPDLKVWLLMMSSLAGLAAYWLFRKLRLHEVADSELLQAFERRHANDGFAVVHGRRVKGLSAYLLWSVILLSFITFAFFGAAMMAWPTLQRLVG